MDSLHKKLNKLKKKKLKILHDFAILFIIEI